MQKTCTGLDCSNNDCVCPSSARYCNSSGTCSAYCDEDGFCGSGCTCPAATPYCDRSSGDPEQYTCVAQVSPWHWCIRATRVGMAACWGASSELVPLSAAASWPLTGCTCCTQLVCGTSGAPTRCGDLPGTCYCATGICTAGACQVGWGGGERQQLGAGGAEPFHCPCLLQLTPVLATLQAGSKTTCFILFTLSLLLNPRACSCPAPLLAPIPAAPPAVPASATTPRNALVAYARCALLLLALGFNSKRIGVAQVAQDLTAFTALQDAALPCVPLLPGPVRRRRCLWRWLNMCLPDRHPQLFLPQRDVDLWHRPRMHGAMLSAATSTNRM